MLTNIMNTLAQLREGITKPDARIIVEEHTLVEPGDAIQFQFIWYTNELLRLSTIISRVEIDRIRGEEEIIIERLIRDVNEKLEIYHSQQESEETNP